MTSGATEGSGIQVDRTDGGVVVVRIPAVPSPPATWPKRELDRCLLDVIEDPATRALVIDMEDIDFAGTVLLSLLVEMHIKSKRRGKPCLVSGVRQFMSEVLKTTCLDKVLDLHPDRATAVAAAARHLDA